MMAHVLDSRYVSYANIPLMNIKARELKYLISGGEICYIKCLFGPSEQNLYNETSEGRRTNAAKPKPAHKGQTIRTVDSSLRRPRHVPSSSRSFFTQKSFA